MATSKSDIKTKIAELRHEILSYKPGKAVPCDDALAMFPDQLVIGLIDLRLLFSQVTTIVPTLRCAIHGDVESIKYAIYRRGSITSIEDQEKYLLTDYISVIERSYDKADFTILIRTFTGSRSLIEQIEDDAKDLAAKVGCFVVLTHPLDSIDGREAIRTIKEITGRYPIVGLWNFSEEAVEIERKRMREEGIVEVYEIPASDKSLSDTEQSQLLNLLHGCLREGDVMLANNQLPKNQRYSLLYERAKKEITEAKQKMIEEIRQHERMEESLQQEMKQLQMKLEESSARCESFVDENERLKIEIVREKEKREQAELAITENDKMAKNSQEMYKQREAEFAEELKAKEQKIKAQEDKCKEKEETLKQQDDRLETEIEERTRLEKEKLSVESALKNELKSEKERVEQLERETWKLRTKIQLESEIRSEEQMKKAETPQWMKRFISWMASSGNQMQSGSALSEVHSRGALEESDGVQEREEIANDEFADILNQIADSLSKNAEIDSLGGQLGILQGEIERYIMTNHRYHHVTSDGTREMLKQWRKGVREEDERIELRRALIGAKMINLADKYLPTGEVNEGTGASCSQSRSLDDRDHDDVTGFTLAQGRMTPASETQSEHNESHKGTTGSEHSKAEDFHIQLSNNAYLEQGSPHESQKHNLDDEQYAPEDIPSGSESKLCKKGAERITGSEHTKKVEDPHRLSRENGTASKQLEPPEESPNHSIDDKQYTPEDIPSGEDSQEVAGSDEPNKLHDPHGQSRKDGPSLAQGSPSSRGRTECEETTTTIDRSSLDDTSCLNREENDGESQQSAESSYHSTAKVQDTSENMPSGELFNEKTSTSAERQVGDITTKFDDLVYGLGVSNMCLEKLYVLFFAKVIIDICQKLL